VGNSLARIQKGKTLQKVYVLWLGIQTKAGSYPCVMGKGEENARDGAILSRMRNPRKSGWLEREENGIEGLTG